MVAVVDLAGVSIVRGGATARDRETLVLGVSAMRKIFQAPAMARYIAEELEPVPAGWMRVDRTLPPFSTAPTGSGEGSGAEVPTELSSATIARVALRDGECPVGFGPAATGRISSED